MTLHGPTLEALHALGAKPDDAIELGEALLLLSKAAQPELELSRYQERLEVLAAEVRAKLEGVDELEARVRLLCQHLAVERGFRGNIERYYDPRNSFLSDVLDRGVGIPIALAALYIEVGRRAGLELVGVGFPFHFLVKAEHLDDLYIDPFHDGEIFDGQGAKELLERLSNGRVAFEASFLEPVSVRRLVVRVLRNLKNVYGRREEPALAIAMSGVILAWSPGTTTEYRDRGRLHLEREDWSAGIDDLQEYIVRHPHASDRGQVVHQLQHAMFRDAALD